MITRSKAKAMEFRGETESSVSTLINTRREAFEADKARLKNQAAHCSQTPMEPGQSMPRAPSPAGDCIPDVDNLHTPSQIGGSATSEPYPRMTAWPRSGHSAVSVPQPYRTTAWHQLPARAISEHPQQTHSTKPNQWPQSVPCNSNLPQPLRTHFTADVDPYGKVSGWLHDLPDFAEEERYGAPPDSLVYAQPDAATARRPANPNTTNAIQELATAIAGLANNKQSRTLKLPGFSGQPNEWLVFKSSYENTQSSFDNCENLNRLRAAVRGEARDAIASLLATATHPQVVMRALEMRFARPQQIIAKELAEVRALPKLGRKDFNQDLNIFACKLRNCISTISYLREYTYLYSPELFQTIVTKLSPILLAKWTDYAAMNDDTRTAKLELLARFLEREADRAMRYGPTELQTAQPSTSHAPPPQHRVKIREIVRATSIKPQLEPEAECTYCGLNHKVTFCEKFQSLNNEERWAWAQAQKLCYRCLRKHNWTLCQKICNQKNCRKPHHQLLHKEPIERKSELYKPMIRNPSESSDDTASATVHLVNTPPREPSSQPTSDSAHAVNTVHTGQSFLKIVPVTLFGPKGNLDTFAFLDDGSTATLIDADIANSLGIVGPTRKLSLEGITGTQHDINSMSVEFDIKGKNSDKSFQIINAQTIPKLQVKSQQVDKNKIMQYDHLKDLVELLSHENAKPTILIGSNNWHVHMCSEYRAGKSVTEPVGVRTNLGWVIWGGSSKIPKLVQCNYTTAQEDDSLNELIKSHYSLDSLGIYAKKSNEYTEPEKRAIKILNETSRRLSDSHFEVGLLWKNDSHSVPPSRAHALSRLKGIEKKCAQSESYAKLYSTNINAYIEKNYAEECTTIPKINLSWYLPHFGVTHPQKPGKLRIVLDAAARSGGVSLNDLLLPGPDLLNSLLDILFRFREGQVAVTGDIREMFSQIRIREADRDFQRYLWREDPRGPVKEHRMTTVIFGAASSPCTAQFIKNKNAKEFEAEYPEAARAIEQDHYMDDYLQSHDDLEHIAQLAAEVLLVHGRGGFEMRNWVASKPDALKFIPQELHKYSRDSTEDQEVQLKVPEPGLQILGMLWFPNSDEFSFNRHIEDKKPVLTKRQVLRNLMRIFDPLGLLTPLIIYGKILFQRTWQLVKTWDEPLPDSECSQWRGWYEALAELQSLRVPRCYFGADALAHLELHVFADASELAFAAVAYWRAQYASGKVSLTLIASKARVAPTSPVTVPRLELQAALIAARLGDSICKAHRRPPARRYFWVDSKTALSWIRADARSFKRFVAHRVGEITELTHRREWRWVPGPMNPADEATRPILRRTSDLNRWLDGPEFLLRDEWPSEDAPNMTVRSPEEIREWREFAAPVREVPSYTVPDIPNVSRFSNWLTFVRSAALVSKFSSRLLARIGRAPAVRILPLVAGDLRAAQVVIWRNVQSNAFPCEISFLRGVGPHPKRDRIMNLNPHLDESFLVRKGGRIGNAENTSNVSNNPIILPGNDKIVRLYIKYYHERFAHGNNETVVNLLKKSFCILDVRTAVRSVARACQLCRNNRAVAAIPPEGALPAERLAHHSRPFTHIGLDYFGPITITVGRRHEKRWVALYTCMTTRAVHLEIIQDLSADAALMGLSRMTHRRGCPTTITSDNSTAFHGAANELRKIPEFAANEGITWNFIPPAAPFMGGAWERLIKSVKRTLQITLHERYPKEATLSTVLCAAEAILNSRPLTYVPIDPRAEEALTPFHFLIGTSSGSIQVGPRSRPENEYGRKEWRKAQHLADRFWERWVAEYLPQIRRPHYVAANPDVREGDMVLIVDPSLPRGMWPVGRIDRLFHARDGVARTAEVQTKAGLMRRPVRRLVVLPVHRPEEE